MAVIEINNPIVSTGRTTINTGTANLGTPAAGTFGAGALDIGSLVVSNTNGKVFVNTGTKASPTWTVVGGQS